MFSSQCFKKNIFRLRPRNPETYALQKLAANTSSEEIRVTLRRHLPCRNPLERTPMCPRRGGGAAEWRPLRPIFVSEGVMKYDGKCQPAWRPIKKKTPPPPLGPTPQRRTSRGASGRTPPMPPPPGAPTPRSRCHHCRLCVHGLCRPMFVFVLWVQFSKSDQRGKGNKLKGHLFSLQ